ncbi:MAG: DUF2344 domain-containing protein [Oscillospiraceae bacterium]
MRELKWLRVTGRYEYDNADPADMAEKLRAFYARDAIVITRKTKRGEGQMDIVPAISELHVRPEVRFVTIEAVVSAQEPTLNPDHLVTALHQLAPSWRRTSLLSRGGRSTRRICKFSAENTCKPTRDVLLSYGLCETAFRKITTVRCRDRLCPPV